jgi:ribosome-associated protein
VATSRDHAYEIGRLLAEHRGGDVTLLDVTIQSGWTDFFIIATAGTVTQLRALARFVGDYAAEADLPQRGGGNIADDEEWVLLDLGDLVVHLMTERARTFYELERLWFQSEAVKIAPPAPPKVGAAE